MRGRTPDHLVGDARQLGYLCRNGHAGIGKGGKGVGDLAVDDLDRADLSDPVAQCGQTGGFYIKTNKGAVERLVLLTRNRLHQIIHKVGFDTVDDLDIAAELVFDGFRLLHGVRKRLRHAVVGDGDRLVTPVIGALYERAGRRQRVHLRHVGVHVQLHALGLRLIDHLDLFGGADRKGVEHDFL